MFTGIIEEVGGVAAVEDLGAEGLGGGRRLTVEADFAGDLRSDQSISVNGACQTVVEADAQTFSVVAVEETLRKTTLGGLRRGASVNLDRAITPQQRFDGHFVQGHVDAAATIRSVEEEETDRLYTIRYDPPFAAYLIPVGSVTVDGISLTVARLAGDTFTVAVIPHTYARTNVPTWEEDAQVNIEFDLIGKYVARQLRTADPRLRGGRLGPRTAAQGHRQEAS